MSVAGHESHEPIRTGERWLSVKLNRRKGQWLLQQGGRKNLATMQLLRRDNHLAAALVFAIRTALGWSFRLMVGGDAGDHLGTCATPRGGVEISQPPPTYKRLDFPHGKPVQLVRSITSVANAGRRIRHCTY
jgi:hypothetical protein